MGGVKRITLRFYEENPQHAEFLELLERLPTTGRGMSGIQKLLEPALLKFARQELKALRKTQVGTPGRKKQTTETTTSEESVAVSQKNQEETKTQGLFKEVASNITFR